MSPFKSLRQKINDLSPDCRSATRLQSETLDHRLKFSQRLGLRIHLILCRWCRRYARQLGFLRKAAKHCNDPHSPAQPLRPEARERIKQAVREAGK